MDSAEGLLVPFGSLEDPVEGGQECGAARDAQGCVLALPHEGTEFGEGHGLFVQQVVDLFAQGLDFGLGEFDGAVEAIKNPAENLFAGVPDSFFVQD